MNISVCQPHFYDVSLHGMRFDFSHTPHTSFSERRKTIGRTIQYNTLKLHKFCQQIFAENLISSRLMRRSALISVSIETIHAPFCINRSLGCFRFGCRRRSQNLLFNLRFSPFRKHIEQLRSLILKLSRKFHFAAGASLRHRHFLEPRAFSRVSLSDG